MTFFNPFLHKNGVKWIPFIILAAIGFLIYSNTFECPFVFDDIPNIVQNPFIRMKQIRLVHILDAGYKSPCSSRPLSYISWAFNYYFHNYDVKGYHLVNIIIHILTGFFVFRCFTITMERSFSSKATDSKLISWVAALIWLVHPLHTQSVTYLVQRMNSMCAMFYMSSFLFYLHAGQAKVTTSRWAFAIFSAIMGLFAYSCKEIAITLPFFIVLYDFYFFQNLKMDWIKKHLFKLCLMFASVLVFALWALRGRHWVALMSGYDLYDFTMPQRLLTELRVVINYIGLILFPHPDRLIFDHAFPLSHSLLNPITTLLSLTLILFFIFYAVYVAKTQKLLSFCILWFFGNLILESSFIPLDISVEHRTYLPSMFLVLLITALAYRHIPYKKIVSISCLIIVLMFSFWTYERNKVYASHLSLWADCVRKAPENRRAQNNLGNTLMKMDHFEEAEVHLKAALRIDPDGVQTWTNLGVLYSKRNQMDSAIRCFQKAISLNSQYGMAYYNLAKAYEVRGDIEDALKYYTFALKLMPSHVETLNNLGTLLYQRGRLNKSILLFKEALKFDPDYQDAQSNLSKVKDLVNSLNAQIDALLQHLNNHPDNDDDDDADTHVEVGDLYLKTGDVLKAISHFKKSVSQHPAYAPYAMKLLKAYAQAGHYNDAMHVAEKIIQLQPKNPEIDYLIASLYARQKEVSRTVYWLKSAYKKGYSDWDKLKKDPNLEYVRSKKAFQEAVSELMKTG